MLFPSSTSKMNFFCDFQKAWAQRFPGCELPQVWVEDIRANLTKHRQKLAALKEELEKVEFYVQYLENLMARYVEISSSQTESDYVVFNECSSQTEKDYVVFNESSSQTENDYVVFNESSSQTESDYVVFNESHDSHQECPSIVSSHERIAECLLDTQNSVVEKSPECTASMKTVHLLKNQKSALSKNFHCESAAGFANAYSGHSFCDHDVELEHVDDYSEKKGSETSENSDDVFEVDSSYLSHPLAVDKLVKSVDMSKIAASNLTSSVDDIKYNCQVLLCDVFAGRKRKKDQEEDEANEISDHEKDDGSDYEDEAKENSDHEKDDDSDYEWETIRSGKNRTLKKAKKETLSLQEPNGLSSYEKMIEEKRAERIALLKSMEIYQIKEGISEAIGGIKQLKKNPVKKVHFPSSIEPIRRSNRVEKALEELAMKKTFQVPPDSSAFEFSFEDALKSKSPYEKCVNDLSVQKPKCNQECISYDKAVFENMTLKNFHIRKVFRERITSVAWYPSKEDLIVAAGDRWGNLGLWKIQDSETTPYLFSIHDGIISNLQFNSFDPVQLITSSFDGTMLCGDLIKHTFNEIYNFGSHRVTWFDFLSHKRLLVSYWNEVAVLDSRTNGKIIEQRHTCSDHLINTVSVHPVNKNIFVTCDSKKRIRLWDLRKLQKDPIVEILHHKNTVNSAYFSPITGNSILTTSVDDSICIFDSTKLTQDIQLTSAMNHNNAADYPFKATWLPHSDDLFAVSLRRQKEEQRKIQIYDKNLNLYHNMKNDNLKTGRSVHCFHPYRSALAVGSKAGNIYVFT